MDFKDENYPILESKPEPKIKCTHRDLTRGMTKAIKNDRDRLSSGDFLTILTNLVGAGSTYTSGDSKFLGVSKETALLFWVVVICLTAIPIGRKVVRSVYHWDFLRDDINDRVNDVIGEIANHDAASEIFKAVAQDKRQRKTEPWIKPLLRSLKEKVKAQIPEKRIERRVEVPKTPDQHAS